MSGPAIRTSALGKRYAVGVRRARLPSLRDRLSGGGAPRSSDRWFWALEDVSFEVAPGEVVGLIGRNGAGKTTLLRILSRITPPTTGEAEIRGRVGTLLEVGSGFHPELTGRDNVYLNGAILGMRRREIDSKLDDIVAFSGVERFLDTPVKHYSTGMHLRLAFAVAAHLEPEILLVDEVLAVGDAAFQRKCLGKMSDIAGGGRTILFVSHNMGAIQQLCRRCIWIDGGRIAADGKPLEVIGRYLETTREGLRSRYESTRSFEGESTPVVQLRAAEILGPDGDSRSEIRFGEPFSLRMTWEASEAAEGVDFFLRAFDMTDRIVFAANTFHARVPSLRRGTIDVVVSFPDCSLAPGEYWFAIGAYRRPRTTLDLVESCIGVMISDVAHDEEHTFSVGEAVVVAPRARWVFGDPGVR